MSNNEKNNGLLVSETYVKFIDVLFAVVLGQSFSLLTSKEAFRPWWEHPFDNAFGIATILLVYSLVITSWVGYHQSVKKYPIKNISRFIIDIFLLFLYYFAFVNADKFEAILAIFAVSFGAYAVWDLIRLCEHHVCVGRDLLKRFGYSLGFAIVFVVVYFGYSYLVPKVSAIGWAFFVTILVLLIVYRWIKWYKGNTLSHDS